MTETEKIIRRVKAYAPMDEQEIYAEWVGAFLRGKKRARMLLGQRYYENRGDILQRAKFVIGADGRKAPDTETPASRIAHGFVRKLVDQKAQYLFGRPFTIRCENRAFSEALDALFDARLRAVMRGLCKEAVNKGIAWLQAWPEDGEVKFRKIPSEELLPVWADRDHRELEAALRLCPVVVYEGRRKERKLRVQLWDRKGVREYWYEAGRLVPDGPPKPHITLDGEGMLLEKLPFIPFKYNEEELPLIQFVKPLIDDYDWLKSEDADNLGETSGALMVLQNYDGTDLGEFRENLARYRAVKVSDGGGLEIKEQPVHTADVMQHLQQDRKDIYETGRGVDTQSEKFGAASGVALKFLYADLDLDCAGIEGSFAEGFGEMVRLTGLFYSLMGRGDFAEEKAEIILNRDIIISESDAVEQCAGSAGLLSRRTVLENHPWVVNVEEELDRLRAEAGKKEDTEDEPEGYGGRTVGSGACADPERPAAV